MVQICALASGSNGNCYYVGNGNEAVIIDCGITNKLFNERLKCVGLNAEKIKAVFISHEHTDHVKGMRVITTKNNLDAYISKKTYHKSKFDYQTDRVNFIKTNDVVAVGNIKVHAFNKQHDAVDPMSFRVELDGLNIAVLTDLGIACAEVQKQLAVCDAAFLETNYDHDTLFAGSYPYFLKNRVACDKGHLSNKQAFDLVNSLNSTKLKTIILSHISADNNSVKAILNTFSPLKENHCIELSSRHGASKLIEL